MLIKLHEDNPNPRDVDTIVDILKSGGVIIYPTDTLYAFGCDITKSAAIEKICRLKKIDPSRMPLSFVCNSISQISSYANLDNKTYSLLKECLPGPFTFLLKGNSSLPKLFKQKKIVGVRMPDNNIVKTIIEALGNPILSSSIFIDNDEPEYTTNPELIEENLSNLVDCVIDGGEGGIEPSTIVDCTEGEPYIKRYGKGDLVL